MKFLERYSQSSWFKAIMEEGDYTLSLTNK